MRVQPSRSLSLTRRLLDFLIAFKRRMFLNPASLHGNVCNMEAQVLCDANRIEVSCIRLSRSRPQRSTQCLLDRLSLCSRIASPRTRIGHPDEMPACLPDHGVKHRCRNLFDAHPVFAKGSPKGVQRIWQDAVVAQEDGMEFHKLPLPKAASAGGTLGAFESPAGLRGALLDEWSATKSLLNLSALVSTAGSFPGRLVVSGWLAGTT